MYSTELNPGLDYVTIANSFAIWVTPMKTTIEISDELLQRSRKVARREGATLKALIEEGLRLALRARERKVARPLRLRPFDGDGLTAAFRDAGWDRIRDEIYRGRD